MQKSMTGFILIDKPTGITSFDVIARLRRLTGVKRIGHAGTLDPFATGLLIVAIGREATREMSKFVGLDKTYEATFVLGATSTTDDVTGKLSEPISTSHLTEQQVKEVLESFVGELDQVPPTYAAIKVQGKKLYELARAGTPTLVEPRRVTLYSIENLSEWVPLPAGRHGTRGTPTSTLHIRIHCSSGTYIRSIARDLGAKLRIGGYVSELRRTSIGLFAISEAFTLEELNSNNIENNLIKIDSFIGRLT